MRRELNDASLQYLLWAAKTGDLARITDLVKMQKVDPDISDENQYTALHLAAAGKGLQLLFRLATFKDLKPPKRAPSPLA